MFTGEYQEEELKQFNPTGLPAPPNFEQLCGYQRDRRYVALYWGGGDELYWSDGHCSATGNYNGWLELIRHPVGQQHLYGHHFGNSDEEAREWLLIDRATRRMYAGPSGAVDRFLYGDLSKAPQVQMTREEWGALCKEIKTKMESVPCPTVEELQALLRHEYEQVRELRDWLDEYARLHQASFNPERCISLPDWLIDALAAATADRAQKTTIKDPEQMDLLLKVLGSFAKDVAQRVLQALDQRRWIRLEELDAAGGDESAPDKTSKQRVM